jgi:predicted DNA-binding transcriptional regulator YafY
LELLMKFHEVLTEAIDQRKRIEFTYQSNTEDAPTRRVVDPWIYGDRNGKPALFGYQVEGGSGSECRRFNVGKIHSLRITDQPAQNRPESSADITKWDGIHAQWAA